MKRIGYVISVTKQTQAREGLRYTLEASRVSPEVVLVSMEIPREGKLKDVSRVSMEVRPVLPQGKPGPVSYSPYVSAPLLVTVGKNGAWNVAFQLAPELAERSSVNLLIPKGLRGYFYYAVELKEYITDASSR